MKENLQLWQELAIKVNNMPDEYQFNHEELKLYIKNSMGIEPVLSKEACQLLQDYYCNLR